MGPCSGEFSPMAALYAATVVFTNKRSQAEDIYSLFSTKYLGDNRDNVHFQSLCGDIVLFYIQE